MLNLARSFHECASRALLLVLLVAFAAVNVAAELPPSAYKQMQAKAGERLQIEVLSIKETVVRDEPDFKQTSITIEARVVKVLRTRSRTKRNQTISITYLHDEHSGGWAGPSPVPILEQGKTYPAFLTKSKDGVYAPAAGGHSFDPIK